MGGTECLLRGLRPMDKVSVSCFYRSVSVTHQDHSLGGSLSNVGFTHWYIKHDGLQGDVKARIIRKGQRDPEAPKKRQDDAFGGAPDNILLLSASCTFNASRIYLIHLISQSFWLDMYFFISTPFRCYF